MSNEKTCFIYIHGIQPLKRFVTGYSESFHKHLLKLLKCEDVDIRRIGREEVVWSDVTFPLKDQYLQRQFKGRPKRSKPVQAILKGVQPGILDILFYVKNKGGENAPGEMKVLKRLHAKVRRAKDRGYKRVVIWAHSLGSVAAYDYVFRFRGKFALPKSLFLDALITFGSPVSFFASSMGYPYSPLRLPENVGRWINFWDKEDFIACRCEPHFPKGLVRDILVDTAWVNPEKAHTGYWRKDAVIRRMAEEYLEGF